MPPTPAFRRFIDSMEVGYEQWHDGRGYDVAAIAGMSDGERQRLVGLLTGGLDTTWREVEALAAIDLQSARDAVDEASRHHLSADTRLAAAAAMHDAGRLDDAAFDTFLARELRGLSRVDSGLTRALLLAENRPSDVVKQALLWSSYNRTECAPHCAALLCYLAGAGKDPFDWSLRPLFLRLGLHESQLDRKAAFNELCALVGMSLDTPQ